MLKRKKAAVAKKAAEVPNIQYVGKKLVLNKVTGKETLELRPAEEIAQWYRDGNETFKLPSGEEQLKGFYHKDADQLIRAFSKDFKRPVKKGK